MFDFATKKGDLLKYLPDKEDWDILAKRIVNWLVKDNLIVLNEAGEDERMQIMPTHASKLMKV